jgi:hypothetical protein
VTIEVTVTVVGGCWAPAPPATAPTPNPITPQIRPATQPRRHHGSWFPSRLVAPAAVVVAPSRHHLAGSVGSALFQTSRAPRTGEVACRAWRLHDANQGRQGPDQRRCA